jgi:hypothetical protein
MLRGIRLTLKQVNEGLGWMLERNSVVAMKFSLNCSGIDVGSLLMCAWRRKV